MNKIIAFLGTEKYDPTTYYYEGAHSNPTCYLLEALACQFYPGYSIRLLCTKEAKNQHLAALRRALGEDVSLRLQHKTVEKIDTEKDLWEIFEVIQQQVDEGDNVVFDLTHSFRALPFLAFLAVAYLRAIRKFQIEAVIYAPYIKHEKSEVYNIREFVDLLDWIVAAELFTQTGYATRLAELLKSSNWWSGKAYPAELERVTAALRLARPDEAREAAFALTQSLADIEPLTLPSTQRPFGVLLERIKVEFTQIAAAAPDPNDLLQELEQELAFVQWNVEHGQLLTAVTVAREWLVSLACWHAGWTDWIKETDRAGKEIDVPRWRSKRRDNDASEPKKTLGILKKLATLSPAERQTWVESQRPQAAGSKWLHLWDTRPDYAELLGRTWEQVRVLRNDLDHAGTIISHNPLPLDVLCTKVQEIPRLLEKLYQKSGAPQPVP